ncbi:MAG: hypothetical protein PHC51_11105 [bacterium]|nr:hypothetical protein [bacterium]
MNVQDSGARLKDVNKERPAGQSVLKMSLRLISEPVQSSTGIVQYSCQDEKMFVVNFLSFIVSGTFRVLLIIGLGFLAVVSTSAIRKNDSRYAANGSGHYSTTLKETHVFPEPHKV